MTAATLYFGASFDLLDPAQTARSLERLERLWAEGLPEHISRLEGFRERLARTHGRGLDGLVEVHASALEAVDWGRRKVFEELYDVDYFDAYYSVVLGLAGRGLKTFAEVEWLLRGGFPDGALARVRTLHELSVIGGVLAQYGRPDGEHPELVERYLRHHEVFDKRVATDLMDSGELEIEHSFDTVTLALLDQAHQELLAKFGKSFATPWGWAAPIFPPDGRVSLAGLTARIAPRTTAIYSMASSHVHADSQGWHDSFIEQSGERVSVGGPTNHGLALPASLASGFLLSLLELVVPGRIDHEGVVDESGLRLLKGVEHLQKRAVTALGEGDGVVEEAEKRRLAQMSERPPSENGND